MYKLQCRRRRRGRTRVNAWRFSSRLLTEYATHELCAWFHHGFRCIRATSYLVHKDARRRLQGWGISDNALWRNVDLNDMEYRRDPRFQTNQTVSVTDLENSSSPLPGQLVDFSNLGIRLLVPCRLPPGTAVKVQWAGTLLLGEVIYCRPGEEGFDAGLKLEDALYDTEALAAMVVERPARQRGASSG